MSREEMISKLNDWNKLLKDAKKEEKVGSFGYIFPEWVSMADDVEYGARDDYVAFMESVLKDEKLSEVAKSSIGKLSYDEVSKVLKLVEKQKREYRAESELYKVLNDRKSEVEPTWAEVIKNRTYSLQFYEGIYAELSYNNDNYRKNMRKAEDELDKTRLSRVEDVIAYGGDEIYGARIGYFSQLRSMLDDGSLLSDTIYREVKADMGVLKWRSPREKEKSKAAQSLFTSLCERAKVEDNKDNFNKLFEIVKAGGELSQDEERIFYSAFAENKKFGVGFVTSKDESISELTDEAKLFIAENCDSLWHLLKIRGALENNAAGEVDKAISKLLLKNDDNVSKRFRDDCYHAGDYNKVILEDWMKSFDAAKLVEAGVDPQALAESIDEYFRGDKKTKILDKFEFPYKMSWSDKRDGIREYLEILSGWKGIALGSDMNASNLESDYKKIATMSVYARMLNLAVLDVRTNGFHDERKNEFIKHVNKKLVNEGMEPVTEFKDAVTMYADMEKKRLETGYERFEEEVLQELPSADTNDVISVQSEEKKPNLWDRVFNRKKLEAEKREKTKAEKEAQEEARSKEKTALQGEVKKAYFEKLAVNALRTLDAVRTTSCIDISKKAIKAMTADMEAIKNSIENRGFSVDKNILGKNTSDENTSDENTSGKRTSGENSIIKSDRLGRDIEHIVPPRHSFEERKQVKDGFEEGGEKSVPLGVAEIARLRNGRQI